MNTRLWNIWDALRVSYWFVPALFALAAVILSMLAPTLDLWVDKSDIELPEWILTTTDTARSTLAAMAGAMMAVTGTVFSITIVTLSLASQQFGPRLLRRFMYDLPTQITLGVFLCAGFYCMFTLRAIEQHEEHLSVPHLAVVLGVILTASGMAALIFYIHHVAMLIQAPHVVAAVSQDLDDAVERLFPAKIGETPEQESRQQAAARIQADQLSGEPLIILASCEGYIQAIDEHGLMGVATKYNGVLKLCRRPGNFITTGSPIMEVWPQQPTSISQNSDGDNSAKSQSTGETKSWTSLINETFITGPRRTPRQDVECAVDELVEVAVRSLSPGINDPFTAISCIDRLGAVLGRLAERELPSVYRCDDNARLRVIAMPVTFPEVLDSAFNQIRQYSRQSVAVTIRLLEALASINEHATRESDLRAISRHAKMIVQHAKDLSEDDDRDDIRDRFDDLIKNADAANNELRMSKPETEALPEQ